MTAFDKTVDRALQLVTTTLQARTKTLMELAKEADVSYQTLYRFSLGGVDNPTVSILRKLVKWAESQ